VSFDDDMLAQMHVDMFATFGVDATAQRGGDEAKPVRIVVDRGQERIGEFGQVVGRVDAVDFLVAQWRPERGDVVAWTDRLGAHSKRIDQAVSDDGFVARVVLHG
jgi:hypothetical protein